MVTLFILSLQVRSGSSSVSTYTSNRGEYTLTFIGQHNYAGLDDTLTCVTQQMDPEEIVRRGIVRTIKKGLIRYVSRTPLAEDIFIEYRQRKDPTEVVDKWDYWVFNFDTSSRYNAEESSEELSLEGSFSADRVTPDWKISFAIDAEYDKEEYDTDERTISSYTRSQEFEGLTVKSIGEHCPQESMALHCLQSIQIQNSRGILHLL